VLREEVEQRNADARRKWHLQRVERGEAALFA
jgi:hypothetical protein